ncbi:FemAB family PEP-CTERM system-associated protein [Aurantiacibacter xanthus]|uniref:FemAB family PEP-CTERM system-associated protein n=1 Tax=Aurantiacibacter xanthus TaxID=1784712 RepID=A0A3A1PDT0_9SPHN|nr:FemAB family XrtA/PEP-CTERM system-associated protein [Aurantiacibacter xanthus]RIV90892.1 FemAB family PEP-CTERM system-associated protein [Aurantiacibacter xanthus]
MNAPFAMTTETVRLAELSQPDECARIEGFVALHGGSVFHRPQWLHAVERGTGQRALGLIAEKGGALTGWMPLTELHSPIFGRTLASSGFAVNGGALALDERVAERLIEAVEELAQRLSCSSVELRGGPARAGWDMLTERYCGFVMPLAEDDEAQLAAIPRKQRAEVRKSLSPELEVTIGREEGERAAHYAVYAESVRNLGTPVFPRSLFDAALDALDADILTVRHQGVPVSSVLSFYHGGAVMPYWGGGTYAARRLRSNDRMYYELMCHARRKGCIAFDFGRSKTGTGPYAYKKTWGFEPQPLTYAEWTVPGCEARDADPLSPQHQSRIAAWKRLPLAVANRLGPLIARGLG